MSEPSGGDVVDPALEAMWRSTVVMRVDAAEGALGAERPADARSELEAALESVLAAAHVIDDDEALRSRLESEADRLQRLLGRLPDRDDAVFRDELAAARRRLEHVFDPSRENDRRDA
jgi:hypothetical protein